MCVSRKTDVVKVLSTCNNKSLILSIHISHEEPCADAIVGNGGVLLGKELLVLGQQGLSLHVAISMIVHETHCPDVAISIVLYDGRISLVSPVLCIHAFLQVNPQCHFATIQGRLLYVADTTVRLLLVHEGLLVGTVRKEITLEYHLGLFHFLHLQELLLCLTEALVLSGEGILERCNV